MRPIFLTALSLLLALAGAVASASAGPTVYTREHEMLVHAIQQGTAEGVITGELARRFRRVYGEGELRGHTTVLQHYVRADCKRLLVVLTKQVLAGPERQVSLSIRLNYCLAGPPPALLEVAP